MTADSDTAPPTTLPDFLHARIAERETAARKANPGGWRYCDVASVAGGTLYDETRSIADLIYEQPSDHDGTIVRHMLSAEVDANSDHIALNDPARVLAECAAQRAIVVHPAAAPCTTPPGRGHRWGDTGSPCTASTACSSLRAPTPSASSRSTALR